MKRIRVKGHHELKNFVHALHHPGIPDAYEQTYFSVKTLEWKLTLLSLGVSHPVIWFAVKKQYKNATEKKDNLPQKMLMPKYFGSKDRQKRSRHRILATPFGEEALSQTFAVAQKEYPEALFSAFNLKDPPSPYELACVLFHWAPLRGRRGGKWGYSFLLWWLAGISSAKLAELHPGWEEEAALAITQMMETPKFSLWALGADMRPVIIRPARARALLFHTPRGVPTKEALKAMRESMYVRGLFATGSRGKGAKRWLPENRPLWHTLDERLLWEEDGRYRAPLRKVRSEGARILGRPKGWVPESRPGNILRTEDVIDLFIEKNPHPGLPWREE